MTDQELTEQQKKVVDALRRCADEIGAPGRNPGVQRYAEWRATQTDDPRPPSMTTIFRAFGGRFSAAVEAAFGQQLIPAASGRLSDEKLLDDLRYVAEKLGVSELSSHTYDRFRHLSREVSRASGWLALQYLNGRAAGSFNAQAELQAWLDEGNELRARPARNQSDHDLLVAVLKEWEQDAQDAFQTLLQLGRDELEPVIASYGVLDDEELAALTVVIDARMLASSAVIRKWIGTWADALAKAGLQMPQRTA